MARNIAIRTVIRLLRNTRCTPNTLFVYHDRREVNGHPRRFHVHRLQQLPRTNRGTRDWTSLAPRHIKEPAINEEVDSDWHGIAESGLGNWDDNSIGIWR